MGLKNLILLAPIVLLQGCWFIFIPGSVTSAISDSITGAEGAHCVSENAKVGDTIRLPGGGRGTIKSLSGTSVRCSNPQHPIRALLVFPDEAMASAGTPPTLVPSPEVKTSKIGLKLPSGWEQRPLLEGMVANGVVHALNRTTDTGALLSTYKREGVTDLMAFAVSRRANQASRLTDPQMSPVSELQVNGKTAFRYQVSGMLKGQKLTYLTTIIEGPAEIAVLNAWTSAANFEYQKEAMGRLSEVVDGF